MAGAEHATEGKHAGMENAARGQDAQMTDTLTMPPREGFPLFSWAHLMSGSEPCFVRKILLLKVEHNFSLFYIFFSFLCCPESP